MSIYKKIKETGFLIGKVLCPLQAIGLLAIFMIKFPHEFLYSKILFANWAVLAIVYYLALYDEQKAIEIKKKTDDIPKSYDIKSVYNE